MSIFSGPPTPLASGLFGQPQATTHTSGVADPAVDENRAPTQELLGALQSLHLNPKYSDLVIRCGAAEHAVHKCIVCTRSDFFAKALDGQFHESSTNMVILDDEEPALVKQMVNYFYTLDYEAEQSERRYRMTGTNVTANTICYKESLAGEEQRTTETTSERSPEMWRPLSFHVLMYSLADRMFIEGLKTLARSKVQKTLFSIFQPLNAHSVQTAIMEIYSSTPITDRGLRDLAVSFAMKNMKELRKGGEQKPGAENAGRRALPNTLLESIPQFAYDLLVATLDKLDGSETLGKSMSGFGFAGATISGGNGSAGRSNFAGGARIAPR